MGKDDTSRLKEWDGRTFCNRCGCPHEGSFTSCDQCGNNDFSLNENPTYWGWHRRNMNVQQLLWKEPKDELVENVGEQA